MTRHPISTVAPFIGAALHADAVNRAAGAVSHPAPAAEPGKPSEGFLRQDADARQTGVNLDGSMRRETTLAQASVRIFHSPFARLRRGPADKERDATGALDPFDDAGMAEIEGRVREEMARVDDGDAS